MLSTHKFWRQSHATNARQVEQRELVQNRGKIRIRTGAELKHQLHGLLEICSILDRCNVRWFLSGGTLLGAVRNGCFIPWDWDVEVTVLTEEALPAVQDLVKALEGNDLIITKVDFSRSNFKLVASGFGSKYEILGLRKKGKSIRARHMMAISSSLFEAQEMVTLAGHPFPAPSPAIGYLEEVYGDWATPKRTAVKSDYLTPRANLHSGLLLRLVRHVVSTIALKRVTAEIGNSWKIQR